MNITVRLPLHPQHKSFEYFKYKYIFYYFVVIFIRKFISKSISVDIMSNRLKIRKPARLCGIRKRSRSLSSNEQVICRKLEDDVMAALILKAIEEDAEDIKILDEIVDALATKYLDIVVDTAEELNIPSRPFNFAFEAIEEDWCYEFLRDWTWICWQDYVHNLANRRYYNARILFVHGKIFM